MAGLEERGVECRLAKNRDGRVGLEDIAALVDARTRVVAVSWVAFHNGWVFPIEEIGRLCRERGILFVVDAIQGLGALPLDVGKARIDVLCADAHKWLLRYRGRRRLLRRRERARACPRPRAGWWNVKTRASTSSTGRLPTPGARRYEPGTLPAANIRGLGAALDLLGEMGPDGRARPHPRKRRGPAARPRRARLEHRLARAARLRHPRRRPALGRRPVVAKALEQRGVIVAPREGAVRFSPHADNDAGEVARALAVIDATSP